MNCEIIFNVRSLILLLGIFFSTLIFSQYAVNGDAWQMPDGCFRLTPDKFSQSGSVWSLNKVNINQDFQLSFTMYFGNKDDGADGMAFVLQKTSNAAGTQGVGIGYQGIDTSFAVEFDTYQNGGEPNYDHCAVQRDGNVNHTGQYNIVPAFLLSDGDIEDEIYYNIFIKWTASDTSFIVQFDCDTIIDLKYDIPNNIFYGDSMVYWGVTSATGQKKNKHIVCNNYVSFFDKLPDTSMCQGDSVFLSGPESMDIVWYPTSYFSDSSLSETYLYGNGSGTFHYIAQDTCGVSLADTFEVNISASSLSMNGDTLGVCSGDSILLNAGSGNNFLWSTGATQASIYANQSGIYSVNITDGACNIDDSVYVESGEKPIWTQDDTIVCLYNLISINMNTSTTYDSIIWNDEQSGSNRSIIASSDSTLIVNVYEDIYSSICTYSDTFNFYLKPQVTILDTNISICPLDTIQIGPNQNYNSYIWNTGSISSDTSVYESGLYYIILTDTSNCEFRQNYTISVYPDLINWQAEVIDVSCFGLSDGMIKLNLSDTSSKQYNWSTGASLNIDSIIGLSAGNFSLTVTDSLLCNKDTVFTIEAPSAITVNTTISEPKCANDLNGSIILNINGGTKPYDIQWNNGIIDSILLNLDSGLYIYSLFDSNLCSKTDTILIAKPDELQITDSVTNILCSSDTNASIFINIQGGTKPYSYNWSNGSTDSNLTNISSGQYYVSISDSQSCQKADSFTINAPNPMIFSFTANNLCYGDTLNLIANDSLSQVTNWTWSFENLSIIGNNISLVPSDTGLKIINLIVEDSSGCIDSMSQNIVIYPLPIGKIIGDTVICKGEQTQLTVRGGTNYSWSPATGLNSTSDSIVISQPDTSIGYDIIITNENNCQDTIQTNIKVNMLPDFNLGSNVEIAPDESVLIKAYDGDTYNWSPLTGLSFENDSVVNASPNTTTTYKLVVTKNNCSSEDEITVYVTIDETYKIAVAKAFTPNGDGKNDVIEFYIKDLNDFEIKIFNRWGQMIFQSKDVNDYWDGKFNNIDLEVDTYTYFISGKTTDMLDVVQKGFIQLVR